MVGWKRPFLIVKCEVGERPFCPLAACRKKNFRTQISQIDADFSCFLPQNQRFQRLSASHFDFSDSLLAHEIYSGGGGRNGRSNGKFQVLRYLGHIPNDRSQNTINRLRIFKIFGDIRIENNDPLALF